MKCCIGLSLVFLLMYIAYHMWYAMYINKNTNDRPIQHFIKFECNSIFLFLIAINAAINNKVVRALIEE